MYIFIKKIEESANSLISINKFWFEYIYIYIQLNLPYLVFMYLVCISHSQKIGLANLLTYLMNILIEVLYGSI